MDNEHTKVEFIMHNNGAIEIHYFDNPKECLYRSWKLPQTIVKELIRWWTKLKEAKETKFPLQKRTKICEFTILTEKYIDIKELDSLGRTNMTGWNLPVAVVEQLVIWQKDKDKQKD